MTNIKASINALDTLKIIITTSGDTEVKEGQDIASPLRLNAIESSQRRHFLKATDDILEKRSDTRTDLVEKAKETFKKENKQKKDEPDPVYDKKMINSLNTNKELLDELQKLGDEVKEIELSDKTIEVLKKYFISYGDKAGFSTGDDEVVIEVVDILGIEE